MPPILVEGVAALPGALFPITVCGWPPGTSTSFKYGTGNKGLNAARVRYGATRSNAFGKISVPTPAPHVHSELCTPHLSMGVSSLAFSASSFEVRYAQLVLCGHVRHRSVRHGMRWNHAAVSSASVAAYLIAASSVPGVPFSLADVDTAIPPSASFTTDVLGATNASATTVCDPTSRRMDATMT